MGLDMYLTKSVYIGANYEHNEIKGEINLSKGDKKFNIPLNKVKTIELEGMYWRKANHIHKWFVDNVQEGKDDCGRYYVSTEQLQQLQSVCEQVCANHELASELLPTQEGFFFGGVSYDEYYFDECQRTATEIKELLENDDSSFDDYYYQSSW